MRNERQSRDITMLNIATEISKRSTCKRRQVGCVLTDKYGRVLSMGHNGVAKGQEHCTLNPCRGAGLPSGTGLELCEAIHAEANALLFCPDITKIVSCYVTCSPCVSCIKLLLNTECRNIHFIYEYPHSAEALELWTKTNKNVVCAENRVWFHHNYLAED